MSPTLIIIGIVIVVLFLFFSLSMNRLNVLYIKARDKGSDLNTALLDRAAQFNKIVDQLDEKGIEHNMDKVDLMALGLGMSATLQMTSSMDLDKKDKKIREILKEHEELKKDEAFLTPYEKFNRTRSELFSYSLEYNKAVHAYSNFTSGFPGGFLINFKKRQAPVPFTYVFVDLDKTTTDDIPTDMLTA